MRRKAKGVTFEDMPPRLIDAPDDAARRERNAWLERHGLALVDLMAWRRSRDPLAKVRPPSRRKWLSPRERAELDERLARGGSPPW